MKKIFTVLLAFLLITLTGCSTVENPMKNDGIVKVYDYTETVSKQNIATVEAMSSVEDITIVFADEYIASRHLGEGWIIVVTPIEVTVLHDIYDDETCASIAGVVAKAGKDLDNNSAVVPMVSAAIKKAKAIEIEESAYTVFLMGFVAFLALTFVASMISDVVPSNSFAGRASSAFLGFAAGFFAGGGGSHKSSSFGGSSGGSATVRR